MLGASNRILLSVAAAAVAAAAYPSLHESSTPPSPPAPFILPILPYPCPSTMATSTTSPDHGITLTALKMYPTFKKELVASIEDVRKAGGSLKLVGILGTAKDDARTYASVSTLYSSKHSLASGTEPASPSLDLEESIIPWLRAATTEPLTLTDAFRPSFLSFLLPRPPFLFPLAFSSSRKSHAKLSTSPLSSEPSVRPTIPPLLSETALRRPSSPPMTTKMSAASS